MLCVHKSIASFIVACTLAGCSSDDDPSSLSTLSWSPCETGQLECSTLEVPMDYNDRQGEKISLSLIRIPSLGQERKGSLLFNPGGPGGSGVELIKTFQQVETIPDTVMDAYDIVSFDPRGVGNSTPVDCAEFGLDEISEYPIGPDDLQEMVTDLTTISAACSAKYGAYLQHLGSQNVVKDMEEIRLASGEDQLHFVGYSYGTRLAALYLQEYPSTSGRMVLDASVHPDPSNVFLARGMLFPMEKNLDSLLATCSDCDTGTLTTRLADRINTLANEPSSPSQDELALLGELVISAVQEPEFGLLAADAVIEYLSDYDASILLQFVISFEENFGEPEEEGADEDEFETAQMAVMCADDAFRPDIDSLTAINTEYNQISDLFAELQIPLAGVCSSWPQALDPMPTIATNTAPASLIIGGTTDTQTPTEWSQAMADAIGGVFVRSEHFGHTAVFSDKSNCVDSIVENFLLNGVLPTDTQCLAD